MTSPKSLQNNFGYAYRTGLRSNALFAALNAAVLFLFFDLVPILFFRDSTNVNHETGQVTVVNFKEQYSFLFSTEMTFSRYLVLAALLGVGLLMGIATFRFITGKKTVNVYYSLGIKRTRLFTAKYLSGLTLVALSVAVPMLVSLIINLVVLGVNRYMMYAFFYLLIGMFSVVAFSYTLTAVVFTTVGTAFEGVLFSGVLLLFPEILFTCLQVFIRKLVLGTPLGVEFSDGLYLGENTAETLTKQFAQFNPLRYLSKGLYTYAQGAAGGKLTDYNDGSNMLSWKTPDFLVPIIWLLVTAALFAFGVFLYERRKAEIGGFIGKNKVLNFVGIFLVGIFGFALAFDLLEKYGMPIALAVGAVVFIVIYAVLSLILLRNLRQFVKDLPALPIQLALTALILVFFATGYFGAANKIPETADIASAQISLPYQTYQSAISRNYYRYSISGLSAADTAPKGKYTAEQDLEFVRNVHKQLVDAGKTEATLMNDTFNGTYPISVKIVYTLKNGKQILRNYYGVSEDIMNALQQADKTVYWQAELDRIFKDTLTKVEPPKDSQMNNSTIYNSAYNAYDEYCRLLAVRESEDIRLYNKTLSTETRMELTAEQRQTLRDCLYKDLKAQTPENHYNPQETLGLISFVRTDAAFNADAEMGETAIVMEGVTTVHGAEPAEDRVVGEDGEPTEEKFYGKSPEDDLLNFFITSDMVNTVNFLKSVGYYDEITADKEIKSIYGLKVAEKFSRSYMESWVQGGESFACEFIAESRTQDNFSELTGVWQDMAAADRPTVYKATDEAMIQSIYKGIVTRGELLPNDYIVVIEYADGTHSKAYVHADKMPEGAKAEIAKNKPSESYYW